MFNYLELIVDEFGNIVDVMVLDILCVQQLVFCVQFMLDQFDDLLFLCSGYYFYSSVEVGFGLFDKKFNIVQVKSLWVMSYGCYMFNVVLEGVGLFGVNSLMCENGGNMGNGVNEGFFLGGFQYFLVYVQDQFNGQYMLYGCLIYLYDFCIDDLFGLCVLVFGVSGEVGNVWQLCNNFGWGFYLKSGSVFVGGNSLIGLLYFGFVVVLQGVWNVYLQFGCVF